MASFVRPLRSATGTPIPSLNMLAVVAFCAAMINYLDDNLANVTGLMKSLGMWENTLMVLSSDK